MRTKYEQEQIRFGLSMETLFSIAEVLDIPVSKLFEA